MNYYEIGANPAKFNKVISPARTREAGEATWGRRAIPGRIELSALNFTFYATERRAGSVLRACQQAPDGDIINVNCTNCTVIAQPEPPPPRSVLPRPRLPAPACVHLSLSFQTALRCNAARRVSFSRRTFSLFRGNERLHLHLNLAVDLAVVQGHHSCRGKGRL